MNKTFKQTFKVGKVSAYGKLSNALTLAASLNSMIDFTPVFPSNGIVDLGKTTAEYNIQIAQRIKSKLVTDPNLATTKVALDVLDSFSKVTWRTVGVATGTMRSIGVKTGINEKYNADGLGEVHQKAIKDSWNLEAIERNERLLDEIIKNAGTTHALVGTDLFTELSEIAGTIMLKSDDEKHMSGLEQMVIVMHPFLATKVSKEMGSKFNKEAPIYKTGLKSQFSINGIPVIVDANLNKFQKGGTAAANSVGAVVLDIESVAFKAADMSEEINVNLGISKFNGKVYYSIEKLVDTSRVTVATMDLKVALTAKASD